MHTARKDDETVRRVCLKEGYDFDVVYDHLRNGFILRAPWNGTQTFVRMEDLEHPRGDPIIAQLAELVLGISRRVARVEIDDTFLIDRIVVDETPTGS